MAKKKIKDIIEELLQDFLKEHGYELYNVEFAKEGKDWFLRVYIDKANVDTEYIGTEDCEKISRYLSEELDKVDPIEHNYYLEVSSPGMDRELLKPEHFKRYEGHCVEVSLYKGIDGKKQLEGILIGLSEEDQIVIEVEKEIIKLPISSVAKTKLAVFI